MNDHLAGILRELCNRTDMLFMLVVAELLLLLISVLGMAYLGPGSAGFVVWVLNVVGLVVLLAFSGTALVLCYRRV